MNDFLTILSPIMGEVKKVVKQAVAETLAEREAARKPSKLLSRKETAEMLNVSLVTLWQLGKQGKLNPISIGRKCVKYSEEDVKSYLDSIRK